MAHVVPWAIEFEDAPASGALARRMTYAANRGIEGVVGPLDCRITQTPTASGNVIAQPGGYIINAKKPVSRGEAYSGYINRADPENAEDLIPIQPNETGTDRYDLVYIRVENPEAPGENWPEPDNPAVGPYVFTRVLRGVPSWVRQLAQTSRATDTAWAAALIRMPANTTQVLDAQILDLRQKAGSGGRATDGQIEQQIVSEATICDGGDILYRENTAWKKWPAQAKWRIAIPPWATGVDIQMADIKNGLVTRFDGGGTNVNAYVWGEMRLNIGGNVGAPTPFDFNVLMASGGGGERRYFAVGGTQFIPPGIRGTVQDAWLEARMFQSNAITGHLEAKGATRASLFLVFKDKPSYE